MDNDSKILKIIIGYCDRIENSKERFGKSKDDFMKDYDYQHTCSFSIAQIGEQVKRLSKEIKEKTPETQWRNISGMKDIITHAYEGINLNIVWKTINEKIPALKETCERILHEIERS
ncbi:MAG: DUF86 domain-containing protein [Methanomassiliicoccaceae archaeon]|nr:DUF86 domain-containing protein [Methanomassiliicoccaceae archaeon]